MKTCAICHKPFVPKREDQSVCWSRECRAIRDRERMRVKRVEMAEQVRIRQEMKQEERTCSLCGSKSIGHVKFSPNCRAIAAANGKQVPGYITVWRPAEYLSEEVAQWMKAN